MIGIINLKFFSWKKNQEGDLNLRNAFFYTIAKNAVEKGLSYAYRDRKNKKRVFRSLWITRINAAAREHGLSYSELINKLKIQGVEINRKVLADLAMNDPEKFSSIIKNLKA